MEFFLLTLEELALIVDAPACACSVAADAGAATFKISVSVSAAQRKISQRWRRRGWYHLHGMHGNLLLAKGSIERAVYIRAADRVGDLLQLLRQLGNPLALSDTGKIDQRPISFHIHSCLAT